MLFVCMIKADAREGVGLFYTSKVNLWVMYYRISNGIGFQGDARLYFKL